MLSLGRNVRSVDFLTSFWMQTTSYILSQSLEDRVLNRYSHMKSLIYTVYGIFQAETLE